MAFTIRRGEQQFGPYALNQVREFFADGRLLPTDLAWEDGESAWQPVSALVGELAPPPPPPLSSPPPPRAGSTIGINPIIRGYADEPERYQKVFRKFDENGGKRLITFNIFSFLFGVLWYFYKGIWKKGFSYLVAAVMLCFFVDAWLVPLIITFICTIEGNYDYYLLKTQGKDWWW